MENICGLLVDKVRIRFGGLIDDDEGGFRAGRDCVDQIFTLKDIGEKARVYIGFIYL